MEACQVILLDGTREAYWLVDSGGREAGDGSGGVAESTSMLEWMGTDSIKDLAVLLPKTNRNTVKKQAGITGIS